MTDVDRIAQVERDAKMEAVSRATEDRKSAPDCWLVTDPQWHGCCCICEHRLEDYSHPHTDGGSCLHRRGFICAAPETVGVYSGWPPHGMCECFELRKSLRV